MAYEIRQMSLAEILDMGFRLLRDHPLVVVTPAVLAYLPLLGPTLLLPGGTSVGTTISSPEVMAEMLLVSLGVGLLIFLFVFPYAIAVITHALGEVYLGRTVSLGGALRAGRSGFAALLGTWLLGSLAWMGGAVIVSVLLGGLFGVFSLAGLPLWAAGVIGVPAAIGAAMYIWLALLLLLVQVVVLERQFGVFALRRHVDLVRGNLLRGLGIVSVAAILTTILTGALQSGLGWIPILGPLVTVLAQGAYLAYTSAVQVVLYFDIRCRKEAFDLEHLSRLVEAETTPLPGT